MIFWCLFAFITTGFEHSVANMTLLAIGVMEPAGQAITIGGYFALFILGELLLYLIFKRLAKKYSSRFAKKMERIISKFSTEAD